MDIKNFDFSDKGIVGNQEISEFTAYYRDILLGNESVPDVIRFEFSAILTIVDELFYAYLLLFCKEFKDEHQREVKIQLFFNYSDTNKEKNPYWIALQQAFHLKEAYGIDIDIRNKHSVNNNQIIRSSSFIPPCLIRKGTTLFEQIDIKEKLTGFFKSIPEDEQKKLKGVFSNNEKFYSTLSTYLVLQKDKDSTFLLYLFPLLNDIDVLRREFRVSLKGLRLGEYTVSELNNINSSEFIRSAISCLENGGFYTFSEIEIYLLRILIGKTPATFKNDSMDYRHYLDKILPKYIEYVKLLARTLYELKKNIIEHTKPDEKGIGVLTARVFKSGVYECLKFTRNHLNTLFNKEQGLLLEVNLIDNGREYIIDNYTRKFRDYNEKHKSKLFDSDINELEAYQLHDLLDFRKKNKLAHQQRRYIARIGLLFFAKNILNHKGEIRISSNDIESSKHQEWVVYINEKNEVTPIENKDNRIGIGTAYSFVIPVGEIKKLEEEPVKEIDSENVTLFAPSTNSLWKLFNY
ncbi:MAG: hypothetical protein K1X55_13035 [Chitinophagales bacterium]|nr:hypothetical protein [Chitinophagales bacterium]